MLESKFDGKMRKTVGCCLHKGEAGEHRGGPYHIVSTIRVILVPFHGILYCYDIPRYIVTLAILISSCTYRR